MNALYELRTLSLVTSSARCWNVDFGNGRLGIGGGQDIVAFMAIGADGGRRIAARDRFRMNALSIRQERAIADAAALHHRFVTVAPPACFGDVASVNRGFQIARRQNRRAVAISAVTIKARRSFGAVLNRLRVEPVIVISMRLRMEQGATEVGQCCSGSMTALALERWIVLSWRALGQRSR